MNKMNGDARIACLNHIIKERLLRIISIPIKGIDHKLIMMNNDCVKNHQF